MLVGPDVSGITDDPEGAMVLDDCRRLREALADDIRVRIHLASIPTDDVTEDAIIVNAVQRHAYVVVQKSLAEGFGLTVTEATWQSCPVMASAVGGIQDQIKTGATACWSTTRTTPRPSRRWPRRVLHDGPLAARLGAAAHQRVQQAFLGDRHLAQYVDLFVQPRRR